MAWYDAPTYIGQGISQGIIDRNRQAQLANVLDELQQRQQLRTTLGNLPQNLTPEQQATTIGKTFLGTGIPQNMVIGANIIDTQARTQAIQNAQMLRMYNQQYQTALRNAESAIKSGNPEALDLILNDRNLQRNPIVKQAFGDISDPNIQKAIKDKYFGTTNIDYQKKQAQANKERELESTMFNNQSDEIKNTMADTMLLTGQNPYARGGGGSTGAVNTASLMAHVNKRAIDLGLTGQDVAAIRAENSALSKTLYNNTKIQTLNENFVNMLDANADKVKGILNKYVNEDSRVGNMTMNVFKKSIFGSGDLNSLQVALNSIALETTKIESGSLGVSGAPVKTFEKFRNDIADINLPVKDLIKVLDTAVQLGKIRRKTYQEENDKITNQISSAIENYKKKKISINKEPSITLPEQKSMTADEFNAKWGR